ncbi:MAG: acido-empty-quinoprotein group A [Terriglobia bacterium]|nr:MAG: acido-empty-quinoprotein group A [Terriglobia bacterium]
MTRFGNLFRSLAALLIPAFLQGQTLDPTQLFKPLGTADGWNSYSGDYSGKRYSALTQLNQSSVKNLALAWSTKLVAGSQGRPPGSNLIIGGIGTAEAGAVASIKASILQVDGILYVSTPDNAWAVDARDGHEIWHFVWKTRGGTHIGNRGLGMWHNRLFMETPDDVLIALDAKTGKEIWHKDIADFDLQYFSTTAPIVIENHIIVGTGNDLDEPGVLQSFDPETGSVQWKYYAVPMKTGDAGLETWANLDAARHGGGNLWVPGSYDPETHLYIVGTGNPSPAYTSQTRGEGDNLYTCSIVAINVETGKMAWYYQTSPHDTHDWDSAQTPVLVDGEINGKMRKLVLQASRNGYYFTLDRLTGEHLVTSQFSETVNWAKGINAKGQPVRDPAKDFHIAGSLVSSANQGATNWPPPSFSPDTGLFYVPVQESYAMYYLAETDPRGAMGLGGKEELNLGTVRSYLAAIDYKTGKTVWRHLYPQLGGSGAGGVLSTAGKLVFAGDPSGNLVAYDAVTGKPLWHAYLGTQVSNAPETYSLDGHQYVLAAAGDTMYSFVLN